MFCYGLESCCVLLIASFIEYCTLYGVLCTESKYPSTIAMGWQAILDMPDDRRFSLTIVALSTISLTVSLSSTSLSNAVPVITHQFQGTDTQAFWSGTAYLLCSAVFQPAFAVSSHHFGRKPLVSAPTTRIRSQPLLTSMLSLSLLYCSFWRDPLSLQPPNVLAFFLLPALSKALEEADYLRCPRF